MSTRVRAIFLSDIHLGTRGCQAERLLDFLREHEAEYIFLVGDIVDFWAMSRGIHWTAAQNTVVQKLLRRARHGEKIFLIPGNHDEALREYDDTAFGDITVVREYIHTASDGKRYLLIHGDEFDQVTRYHRWLAVLGDIGYNGLVRINAWLSWLRRRLNRPGYWSLAGYAKRKVKTAVSFIFDFEDSVIHAARERGVDGVICGHIHSATIRHDAGITYINCGDWVDSCTAIVEHFDGRMELIQHAAPRTQPVALPERAAPATGHQPPREAASEIAVA
ncbi:UDP-2,3-diacylglucosamine diphosphatase [Sulfurisoma sediminicola]|uniref:UDP-2,3-diacylglucosamine pyrophosphatase LpxH n=1 Tax=Sulfurisoma sediminicola TaxID=1381557 RepID=A0A497XAU0_9PROT|nr:UDP-2,3-diacylglucosamine diphosphatase [Sulfurisoma sediminicola]RLJ63503.1 UDP-2,3-diacylglucosamine pyrophosphatase LpxH [Sulfurisoma sediminicola]